MTLGLLVRLLLSMTVVIGGLLAVRWWGLRGSTRLRGIKIVARAPLGRTASVAVLEVGSRRYLIGAAEQSVNLLAELDPDEDLDGLDRDGGAAAASSTEPSTPATDGSVPGLTKRVTPRIGLLAQLRQMTTRVPQGVRIHGIDD